jgi:hypothetical protein
MKFIETFVLLLFYERIVEMRIQILEMSYSNFCRVLGFHIKCKFV